MTESLLIEPGNPPLIPISTAFDDRIVHDGVVAINHVVAVPASLIWARSMIQTMPFGNTGQVSARTLLGAAAFGQVTQREADATLELALSHGINHVDTAASYDDSEVRVGSWIARHGKSFWRFRLSCGWI